MKKPLFTDRIRRELDRKAAEQLAEFTGEKPHRRMEIDLGNGHAATITGDPDMPPETMRALHAMMTHIYALAERGGLPGQNVPNPPTA